MNGLWFNGHLLTLSEGGTEDRVLVADRDIDGRVNVWERGISRYSRIYRDTVPEERVYTVEVQLFANTYPELTRLEDDWRRWHDWQDGKAQLTRLTDNGYWRIADVAPRAPEFGTRKGFSVMVTQSYEFEVPFWRSRDEKSASGAFDGATPATISCANQGDLPSWLRIAIVGLVDDPKFELGDYELEFDIENDHADDEIAVRCQPPATAYRTPNGGSQTSIYGYRTAASTFNLLQLPRKATTDVTLTATSGDATATLYWYEWYNGLR